MEFNYLEKVEIQPRRRPSRRSRGNVEQQKKQLLRQGRKNMFSANVCEIQIHTRSFQNKNISISIYISLFLIFDVNIFPQLEQTFFRPFVCRRHSLGKYYARQTPPSNNYGF